MTPFLLGGEWVERDEQLAVTDPDDGSLVADVARASVADVAEAITHATAALRRRLPAHVRRSILVDVAERLTDEAEESAHLIAREGIKTIREARAEAGRTANTIGLCAEEAGRPAGGTLALDRTVSGDGRFGLSVAEPLGLIVGITPFNDPLNLVAHKVGPALATGNAIIVKPDSRTPLSALRLARMFYDAGLPPGWLQVLPAEGPDVGEPLVSHPDVAMVSLTGGVLAGRTVAAQAGLKKLCMELGANNAAIVEPDADLDLAVTRLGSAMFWAAGQNCLHVQRIYAHDTIVDTLIDGLATHAASLTHGLKLDPDTDIGPLIDDTARKRVGDIVEDAVDRGASLITGGSPTCTGFEPTILIDAAGGSRALTEEIYGPVTVIVPYHDLSDAIAAANDTPYGLAGSVFTKRIDAAFDVASRLAVGSVMINDSTDYRDDGMPFGGNGESGIGREGVRSAVQAMTAPKTITFTDVAQLGLG